MSITISTNRVSAYDGTTDKLIFTLDVEDEGVYRMQFDDLVTLDSLTDLFNAIREAVKIMDGEKIIGEP